MYSSHLTGKKHKKNVAALEALAATASSPSSSSSSSAAASAQSDTPNGDDSANSAPVPASSSALHAPAKQLAAWREIAAVEHQIDMMATLLRDFVAATQAHIEKKQTKTWQEIEAELLAAEQEAADGGSDSDSDSDAEDTSAYNPLNIPLGWDGKPIPYWLYKLHGLNIEYSCEVCGDFSYRGPRAYQRHFQEPRHAQGLRALGIPMLKAFNNITKIADARALWDKVRAEDPAAAAAASAGGASSAVDRAAALEEVEDASGNVFSRRAFDELRRQGLV